MTYKESHTDPVLQLRGAFPQCPSHPLPSPRQNKITVFDVASWICRSLMTWWKYSLHPKYEALCGILVADLMYPMTRTGRFHSQRVWSRISQQTWHLRNAKDMLFKCYQRVGYGWIASLLETMWSIGLRLQSVLASRIHHLWRWKCPKVHDVDSLESMSFHWKKHGHG